MVSRSAIVLSVVLVLSERSQIEAQAQAPAKKTAAEASPQEGLQLFERLAS
jgi:hypothetical protein